MLMERVQTEIVVSINCACFQCHNISVVPVSVYIMGGSIDIWIPPPH
jgi:hypothetical protein